MEDGLAETKCFPSTLWASVKSTPVLYYCRRNSGCVFHCSKGARQLKIQMKQDFSDVAELGIIFIFMNET